MKLSRRQLLKGMAAGAVVIGTPKIVQEGVIQVEELWKSKTISIPKNGPKIWKNPISICWDRKTISIRPSSNVSVLDLHRYLSEQLDKPENGHIKNISSRVTDQIITLEDGWNVDDSAQWLQDGSITNSNGEHWLGVQSVGHIRADTVPLINGKRALRPGHVNQCVKVSPGEEIVVQTCTPGYTYSRFAALTSIGCTYTALVETTDLFWNNPKEDPAYKLMQEEHYVSLYNQASTSRGMRKALDERNI